MADLLFELVTEELPPRQVGPRTADLASALEAALAEAGLPARETSTAWTPRRMTVFAHGLGDRSPDLEERAKGPPEKIAFDGQGNPTKAAIGFAKRSGVSVEDLLRENGRLVAVVRTPGRPAGEIVAQILPGLPGKVPWRKTMRWPGSDVTFARPIRRVVALLGETVVGCRVAGLTAGRLSRGHPFLGPDEVEISSASREDYLTALRDAKVLADPTERSARIRTVLDEVAPNQNPEDALWSEVRDLVEWPSAVLGTIDVSYMELPPRLLVTVMAHHQRFFPVYDGDGALTPRFVAITDREERSADVCRPGFERVLLPRLHDAAFFMREDRRLPLADRLPELETMTYHRKLGTLRDKAARLSRLSGRVAELLGGDDATVAHARRAGLLAKCDLVTHLVGEFPELQGAIGSVYAAADGEPPVVAEALDWQYRHRFTEQDEPSVVAVSLLLADTLDVVRRFGMDVKFPTGSADPFGVRRAALTFLSVCERFAPQFPLTAEVLRDLCGADQTVYDYLTKRLVLRLRDSGRRPDHVDAVTGQARPSRVGDLIARLDDLAALDGRESFGRLLEVAERCRNITRKLGAREEAVDESLLQDPPEIALHQAWQGVVGTIPRAQVEPLTAEHVSRIADAVAEPLHRFFEDVFVNAEDPAVRNNRLALLTGIDRTLLRFADLCKVVTSGAPKDGG